MGGRPDQLHPPRVRLMIGLGPGEARQKRVVDVDAAASQLGCEAVRKNLHIARQHDEVGAQFLYRLPDADFLLQLGLLRDGKIEKRNVAEIEVRVGLARMIGKNAGDLHRHFVVSPAIQQIGEAVVEARHHDHHPLTDGLIPHGPAHGEALGNRAKAFLERRERPASVDEIEDDAHEEVSGREVVELIGFTDVATGFE